MQAAQNFISHRLQTPALLVYLRRGGAVALTPDLLDTLGPAGQHLLVDATHLCVLDSSWVSKILCSAL